MPRLELITGPAGCGKTHHCIETFLDNRGQTAGLSPVFFILPNREHAERIHDLLLRKRPGESEAPKGLLDPAILTINEFLKRMGGIALAKTPGDVLRHALIRTVLAQEKLRYFASSREAPGFVPLVARFIAEAKANFVTARDFETRLEPLLSGDSVFSKKLADLVTLFRGYEERLRSFDLADPDDLLRDFVEKASREGRSSAWRQARPSGVGIIQAGAWRQGLGPPLVIFDGFYHFTRAQMEFLRAVSERIQRVIVTLTLDDRPERAHVFEYAESTRKSLLAMGFRESRWGSKGNFRTGEDALRHLERNLFLPAPASFERPQEAVRIFEATGTSGEIEMVAREILRLYRDGPYHYSDFCLILRTIGPYEALIRSVFASFGIPVAVHERRRLRENPFIHAFLQWIRLLSNGWRRDALAALLASGYYGFPPEEVAQLKAAILEADVGEGREAWSSFLESYKGGGRHILEALLAWHAKLVAESSPSGFAAVLCAFIGKFGLIQRLADASESTREDFQAYRSLRKIMDEILLSHAYRGGRLATKLWRVRPDESAVQCGGPVPAGSASSELGRGGGAMSLEEYLARLLDAADLSLFSVPERSKNCVQVYDIAFALQKEFKVIFLAGLLEQLFPQKIAEDALLKDEKRAELNRLGLPFEERRRRVAGERYFFYMAVTRARERLYLTYPKFDLEGKESLPSFYVEELKRCFQPACLPVRAKGLWEVAPEPSEICGREDLYAALVARLFEKRREIPEEEPSLCAALVNECLGDAAYRRVLASVLRDEDKAWLEDPEILAHFAGWKGPLSATRLELFATCPFKHFSAKVLRLQEKRAGLDPVLMGSLFHKVLEEFYRETRVRRKEDWVFLRDKEKAKKLLFEKLDGLAASPAFAFAGAKKFRKALLRLRLREILDDFVEEESRMERERRTVPHLFEYVFGADEPSGALRIPAAAGPSATLRGGLVRTDSPKLCGESQQGRHHPGWGAEEEEILLQGKIDRIDLDPETGLAVVIDYKSGRYKSDQLMKNLEKGVELQIPVYILAARELLGYRVAGGELYPVADPTGRRGLYDRALMAGVGKYAARSAGALESGDFEAALERVKEQIVDDVARLRRGQIAIRSKGCDHCPYNHVCRFEKWKLIYSEQETAGSRV